MFSIMSSGIPDSAEVVKYKGDVPAWAAFWMPLPAIPKELRDAPFIPHEQHEYSDPVYRDGIASLFEKLNRFADE